MATGSEFRMRLPDGEEVDVWLPLLGRQNVANALAAAAAAQAVGASTEDIVAGLARAMPVRGRLRAVPGQSGATIIDDSYNANPGSVHAALDHLAGLGGRRIFVFGNMAELGPTAPALHAEIGEYARGRCDLLFAIGELASEAAKTFGAAGCRVADIDAARAALDPLARERYDRARQRLARDGPRPSRQDARSRRHEGALMLVYVTDYLTEIYSGFNVFSYLTTRAIFSALTALVLSFALGPYLIQRLQMQRVGQQIRQVGPESHFPKAGTPTMGGALILLAIAISTLLWANLSNRFVLLALGGTLFFGVIGFVDDYKKVVLRNSKGLDRRARSSSGKRSARWGSPFAFYVTAENPPVEHSLLIPYIPGISIPLGAVGYVLFTALVIVVRQQQREFDRRARRPRDHARRARRHGARHLRARRRQRHLLLLSRDPVHRGVRRAPGFLCGPGWRRLGLLVVQHLSRASLHG